MSPAKSKGKAAGSSSQAEAAEVALSAALLGVRVNDKAFAKVRFRVADRTNEHGATTLKPAAHGFRVEHPCAYPTQRWLGP